MARHVLAIGGGGFSDEPENPLLDEFLLGLPAVERPRVLFVPTAGGDSDSYLLKFYSFFAARACEPAHLSLFRREHADLRTAVLAHDIVYVGGGSTANLLAVWRLHGLDVVLREAHDAGVVLAGVSAGANCWFEGSITDSFGPDLQPLGDGLGILPGTMCPHFDGEADRRAAFVGAVEEGFGSGVAADDGAALHFVDGVLVEPVSSRPGAKGWAVSPDAAGHVEPRELPTRYLGAGS